MKSVKLQTVRGLFAIACSAAMGISWTVVLSNDAAAITIDDFSVGAINVIGPSIQTQTGLDPAHVLGGLRWMNVGQFGAGSELTIEPDAGLEFHSSGRGYFELRYDFTSDGSGIDLTQDGSDRIRLEFGEITTSSFTPLALYVTLPPTSSSHGVSLSIGDWDGLLLEFPFSAFPTLTKEAQNLTLDVSRNPAGAALNIKAITTAGPSHSGDYNRDGEVDNLDYLVWRQFHGISTRNGTHFALASADGNGDGQVDAADYTVWRDSLGAGLSERFAVGREVPEPVTWFAALATLFGWLLCFGRRCRPCQCPAASTSMLKK